MGDTNFSNETPVHASEKLRWADPELVQTAVADHTLGGRVPVGSESSAYRLS